jgi:hypothetical protein
VKTKLQQIEEVKKRVIGFEKVKRGNDMLKVKKYMEAIPEFMEALSNNPGLLEAHLGQARALCGLRAHTQAIQHLCFIIEHSTYKTFMLAKLPTVSLKSGLTTKTVNFKLADNELAIDALLQWALVCSVRNDLATGLAICDIVLRRNPGHAKTAEIKRDVMTVNRVKRQVIEVMTKDVGERGHWYKCPNDHFYVVSECGEATQTSECPDCKAVVERGHLYKCPNDHFYVVSECGEAMQTYECPDCTAVVEIDNNNVIPNPWWLRSIECCMGWCIGRGI